MHHRRLLATMLATSILVLAGLACSSNSNNGNAKPSNAATQPATQAARPATVAPSIATTQPASAASPTARPPGSPAGAAASAATARATKTGTVKIGLDDSLSGNLVAVGLPPATGVRLAVKEINDAGGFQVGDTQYKLQLVEADNKSDGATTVATITKLVEDDKVKFIFGPTLGAFANQAQEITVPANVIEIAPASTWQSGGYLKDPKKPLLLDTQLPVTRIAQIDMQGFKQFGVKKVAFLSQDDETTRANQPAFLDAAKQNNIEVVPILFPPMTTDFTSFVSRAKAENVDGMYYLYPQQYAADVLRATTDLSVNPKVFGGRSIDPNVALKDAIGKPLPFPFFTTGNTPSLQYPPNDKVKTFANRLKAAEPNLGVSANFAFFTYDFVGMLTRAMQKAGTVDDTAKIAQAMTALTYDGAAGKVCFDKDQRNGEYDGGLTIVQDGKVDPKAFPSPCQ